MSDWNLQTNIKNKPNAQGTLFSGGKSQMNPAKRYPRGYTPERQSAILGAMHGWGVSDRVTSESDLPNDDESRGPHARRVIDQIMKSSIPPEHLKNLRIDVADRYDEYGPVEHHLDDVTDGHYNHYAYKSGGERVVHGDAVVAHDTSPYTVLHEIGHHVSATAGNPHSKYDSPHQRGREEGFADAYADKHMTPALNNGSRHNWVRGRENYPPGDGQHDGRPDEFHAGYDVTRPYDARLPSKDDHMDQRWLAKKKHEERNPMLPGMKDTK